MSTSLRSEGPVHAGRLWKAVDGFEVQPGRTRPPLPTSPWKTGIRPPVSHSAHRPLRIASIHDEHPGGQNSGPGQPGRTALSSLRSDGVLTISGIGVHDPGTSVHDQRNTQRTRPGPTGASPLMRVFGGLSNMTTRTSSTDDGCLGRESSVRPNRLRNRTGALVWLAGLLCEPPRCGANQVLPTPAETLEASSPVSFRRYIR